MPPFSTLTNASNATFDPRYSDLTSQRLNANVHPEYLYAQDDWLTLRDMYDGERRVKEQTIRYLPKLDGQDSSEYTLYLSNAVFFNATKRTVQGLLGSVFRKDPVFNELPPTLTNFPISKYEEYLPAYLRSVAQEIIHMGRVGILVDRPTTDSSIDRAKTRPYFQTYKAEQILNWRSHADPISGQFVLDQVLLYETIEEASPTGIGTTFSARVRLLGLDQSGHYFQATAPADKADDFANFSNVIYPNRNGVPFDFIPFWIINPTSATPSIEASPLLDIARLNVKHYGAYAALQHGRFFTAMPQYWVKGANEESGKPYMVGPNNVWLLGPDDEAGILEYSGSGLSFLESALDILDRQMQALGARLITQQKKIAAQAAISVQQQEAGERASLSDITSNLNKNMTDAVRFWMEWEGFSTAAIQAASIEYNQVFKEQQFNARDLRALQSLWVDHGVPLSVLFAVFKANDITPNDMTYEDFKTLLNDKSEQPPPPPVEAGGAQGTKPKGPSKPTTKRPSSGA